MAIGEAVGIGTRIKRDINAAVGHLFDKREVLSVDGGMVTVADHKGRSQEYPKLAGATVTPGREALVLRALGGGVVLGVEGEEGETDPSNDIYDLQITVDRITTRQYDIRAYGAVRWNPGVDNIDAINDAILDCHNHAGGEVIVPQGIWYVKPSTLAAAHWITLRSNVTLRLEMGAIIKVRDDTGDWSYLISEDPESSYIENAAITGRGMIDLNPTGNTSANANGTHGDYVQNGIRLTNFEHLTIEEIGMVGGGVWNIYIGGPTNCRDLTIKNTHHTFTRAASAGWFDTTTIYVTVEYGATLEDNYGFTNVAEKAASFMEAHGHGLTVMNNHSDGFSGPFHVTPHSTAPSPLGINQTVVTGNTALRCNNGIMINGLTGVLRDVIVSSNIIHVAQLIFDENRCAGISIMFDADEPGDYDGVQILDNIVTFQQGDTRASTAAGVPLQHSAIWGIGLTSYGDIANTRVAGNIVKYSPCRGILVGRYQAPELVEGAEIEHNLIVDAGGNTSTFDGYRAAIAMQGTLKDVTFETNTIRDTGGATPVGVYSVYTDSNAIVSAENVFVLNTTVHGELSWYIDRTLVSDLANRPLWDPGSLAAGASVTLNVQVKGATFADAAYASPTGGIEDGLIWVAWVSALDMVTIRLTNIGTAAVDSVNRRWNVAVRAING